MMGKETSMRIQPWDDAEKWDKRGQQGWILIQAFTQQFWILLQGIVGNIEVTEMNKV